MTVLDEAGLRAALDLHGRRREESERLHRLTDRWLGEALRGIAAQSPSPTLADVSLEIARRLGCRSIQPGPLAFADNGALRAAACVALKEGGPPGPMAPENPLATDPARGNPMLIALDRVAAPDPARPDEPATRVSDACAWLGIPRALAWHPGMLPPRTDLAVLADILGMPGSTRGVTR